MYWSVFVSTLIIATIRGTDSGVHIYIVCLLTYLGLFYSFPSIYDPGASVSQCANITEINKVCFLSVLITKSTFKPGLGSFSCTVIVRLNPKNTDSCWHIEGAYTSHLLVCHWATTQFCCGLWSAVFKQRRGTSPSKGTVIGLRYILWVLTLLMIS